MAFRSNRGGHIEGEDISAYVDEELSSREAHRVFSHLEACEECRTLADDLRTTKALVREMPLIRAPRDFTLGPEFDAVPARAPAYTPPRRSWFNFMPAAAMSAAILVLLIFVDVSSIGSGVEDSSSGAPAAARSVEDAAKQSAESSAGTTQPIIEPRQGQPVPGAGGNTQGFAPTPPAAAGAPQPATAPPPAVTPMAAQAPAPLPPNATPGTLMLPAVIGSPVANNSAVQATPANQTVIIGPDEAGAEPDDEDGGTSVLRILQIIAAIAFVGSIGGLVWQRQRRG